MASFRFDNPFFQRGQTWTECLESWVYRRRRFLASAADATVLPLTASILEELTEPKRIAVYYNPSGPDTFRVLPLIGSTLDHLSHVETRFFNFDFFFPVLYTHLGRRTPKLVFLDRNGEWIAVWGPGPDKVAMETEKRLHPSGETRDRLVGEYDDRRYAGALDGSIAGFVKSEVLGHIPP